jgi:hypothetical protein
MGRWCDMDSNCQHIIKENHLGGACILCGYCEIADWYGMYDNLNQINGEQHTEQINYEIHDNGN